MTTDPKAAASFEGGLFGWTCSDMPVASAEYRVASVGETLVVGIMGMPPGAPPMPPARGCCVTVSDLDAALARCDALGGKTVMPPIDVNNMGRMAVIQDPQGAVPSLMQYNSVP